MRIPNATAHDIGLRVDSEYREDWNAFFEEEGNWTHGEVWDEGIVESSSSVDGNKIGVEIALEKHGLYMLGKWTYEVAWLRDVDEDRQIGR